MKVIRAIIKKLHEAIQLIVCNCGDYRLRGDWHCPVHGKCVMK